MPRENSFSDSEGRSLTPDPADEWAPPPVSPQSATSQSHVDHAASKSHRFTHSQALHSHHDRGRGRPSESAPAASSKVTRSVRSPRRSEGQRGSAGRTMYATPGDRFRASVRKIIAMHRTSSMLMNKGIGSEPGIDPRRASAFFNYGHIRQDCAVEVVDYSSVRSTFRRMGNREFVDFMEDAKASARESWVRVRWINVGGISWDVVSAMASQHDMHPLALEDVLHQRKHARSKADYYPQHLFVRMLCHTLSDEETDPEDLHSAHAAQFAAREPPESSDVESDQDGIWKKKNQVVDNGRTTYGSASNSRISSMHSSTMRNTIRRKFSRALPDVEMNGSLAQTAHFVQLDRGVDKKSRKNARNIKIIRELKKGNRVNVDIQPMCIFLFRDGTVICMHPDSRLNLTEPITERLRQRDTGLRTTADPSLLVQSLIDLIVDQALEIVEEYQSKILSLEHNVLVKPSMKSVSRLHILQGDLILHKRTLEPIKTMVYGLRRYDVDRVAALSEKNDPTMTVEGFMSQKAKIYLADVHDHMDHVLTSLDMFAGISENLINYTFNMTSYEMNEVMRRLTSATIIFLPLTLLTGYFGMNFQNMWTTNHNHSDVIFWAIALPVMAIVIPVFLWNDISRMVHRTKKRYIRRSVKKAVKEDFKRR